VLNDNSNLKQVISVLHPTPAVCGLPKQETRILFWKMKDTDRDITQVFW
jgi:isochorismate synthase